LPSVATSATWASSSTPGCPSGSTSRWWPKRCPRRPWAVALARLIPNISGPSQMKRRLISSLVESQLLYATPI